MSYLNYLHMWTYLIWGLHIWTMYISELFTYLNYLYIWTIYISELFIYLNYLHIWTIYISELIFLLLYPSFLIGLYIQNLTTLWLHVSAIKTIWIQKYSHSNLFKTSLPYKKCPFKGAIYIMYIYIYVRLMHTSAICHSTMAHFILH